MDYAKKSLYLLSPLSLSKCASMTQQLLATPVRRAQPYRVSNWDRSLRKGIMADSLDDLLEKVCSALGLAGPISVVLDEDGTSVETEEFFQTLKAGTVFVALTKGQTWRPNKTSGYQVTLSRKPRHRIDVACVTFDLYKTNPQDFIGCLNVKATLYGAYTMSYDMPCYGARRIMHEALRWTLLTMQATGHVLLGTSGYVKQLLDASEDPKNETVVIRGIRSPPAQKMLR